MAQNNSPLKPTTRRALAVLATAGAALGVSVAPAAADAGSALGAVRSLGKTDAQAGTAALTDSVRHVAGPVADLKPNPLAGTGVDPLDNGVETQVADFKPVATQGLTRPLTQARSIGSAPVTGRATGLLT